MTKFVNYIIRFRWAIAIMVPIITVFFGMQLKNVQFDGSYKIWFGKESQTIKKYDHFRNTFGNDISIIILFHDENGVMNKKALNVIDRITDKLWKTKYVSRVDSLTNYQYVYASPQDQDDIITEDFVDDIDSLTLQQLEEKAKIAVNEDMIVNRIISKDGKTTMIIARVTSKAENNIEAIQYLNDKTDQYLEEEKESGYKFHVAGGPAINGAFAELGQHDVTVFTPIILFIAMSLLWIIFKRPSGMFLSIGIVIFTFVIVLGIQVMLGYKLNNFTANMPVFIVAIGIADAMHLFWIYLIGRRKGLDNHEAIHYSVDKNFLPIFLTSITTAVGFASLGISEIVPIKTLGIATANAALLAFVLTILYVPAILSIINPKIKEKELQKAKENSSKLAKKYAKFIIRNDIKILVFTSALFILLGLGLTQLKVDSNTIRYFNESVPVRQTVHFIEKTLTGPMTYEIVVNSNEKDGIKKPDFMKTIEKFETAFKEKYPDVRHTSSLVDVVKKFNQVMAQSKTVPDDKNLIAQYLLLYSFSLPQGMEINDKMDVNEQYLRLTAAMNVVDTSLDLEMIKWSEDWWKDTPYSAIVNGQTVMFANMQRDVTNTLIQSILLAISVVSIMMFFIFKSIKMIPLFVIPNVLPIVLVMGVMGWLGINIDIGVAVSGAIIIGVAVDDTIHFLVKYQEARKKKYNFEDSLTYIMQYAGSAIIFTTIILSSAFMILSFSLFNPNVNFGVVTAIALIIAVVVDLIMLPAILSRYDGGDKSFLN